MAGLAWKRNLDEILDRRRRFFKREMQDTILATFTGPSASETEWAAFEKKWGTYKETENRPFPSNEEIFDRLCVGLENRSRVEDDQLPVTYSILDAGESMVGAMAGQPVRFIHRKRNAAFSKTETAMEDYSRFPVFSHDNEWRKRFLSIQEYFEEHSGGNLAQHPCLTMDALNFVAELREATDAYLDLYEQPEGIKALMELGLKWNIDFQEAQRKRIKNFQGGCFAWIGDWVPFDNAVSLSVDAYVISSVDHYVEFGFDFQKRLIGRFGHGLMHFHCNRVDLAIEVAKLPGLELFQFGGDTRDKVPAIERLPEMRKAVGNIPLQINCRKNEFFNGLKAGTLMPNVWYCVGKNEEPLTADEANQWMDRVRAYRA